MWIDWISDGTNIYENILKDERMFIMAKKEYNYYEKFVELVEFSLNSALILKDTLDNFNPRVMDKKLKEMHTIEHSADLAKHEMMQRLATEFIAPIEREDIIQLSQDIDDITDAIEDVLIKMHMYNITRVKPEAAKFTQLICNCCSALKTAMQEFHNFKKSTTLKEKLIEVNRLEEAGDALYYDTVHQLFSNSTDPIELFIWSDIFSRFEKCADACEHAADTIESVVMKNS